MVPTCALAKEGALGGVRSWVSVCSVGLRHVVRVNEFFLSWFAEVTDPHSDRRASSIPYKPSMSSEASLLWGSLQTTCLCLPGSSSRVWPNWERATAGTFESSNARVHDWQQTFLSGKIMTSFFLGQVSVWLVVIYSASLWMLWASPVVSIFQVSMSHSTMAWPSIPCWRRGLMWSSAALQSAMAISRSTPTWLRCCSGDSGIAQEDGGTWLRRCRGTNRMGQQEPCDDRGILPM